MSYKDYRAEMIKVQTYYDYIKSFFPSDSPQYKEAIKTFNTFLDWFGKDWIKHSFDNNNPILTRFTSATGIKKNIKLLNLIYYCENNSKEDVFKEIKKRIKKINRVDLKSLKEELLFFYIFNEQNLKPKKVLESNTNKNPDLKITFQNNPLEVEIHHLNNTEAMQV